MTTAPALRPGWTPLTIGLMVLGFVAFWPLGLAMLAYILWGDRLDDFKRDFSRNCSRFTGGKDMRFETPFGRQAHATGNVAFDEYREREMARLEEERRRLDAMREEFDSFMRNLRRAKDQEEFDRFMNDRNRAAGETSA